MAMLQCEVCGGKLVAKSGGIYECEFCGIQYDTAWAKAKVQEITGTVKVEGTVEVAGTVKVDGAVKVEGGVSLENLLRRGEIELGDRHWQKAKEAFEAALNINAECAQAYLGMCMAEHFARNRQEFVQMLCGFAKSTYLQNALKYADEEMKAYLDTLRDASDERDYQNAKSIMEKGNYDLAMEKFRELAHYRDSAKQLEACENLKKDKRYQEAVMCMENGDYNQAIGILRKLQDRQDARELLAQAKEKREEKKRKDEEEEAKKDAQSSAERKAQIEAQQERIRKDEEFVNSSFAAFKIIFPVLIILLLVAVVKCALI